MSEYKVKTVKNGRQMFFRKDPGSGFKMIAKADVPEDVLANIEMDKVVDTVQKSDGKCIFCGAFASDPRIINRQNVDLCFEHYQNKTTGEIVQFIRENNVKELVNG